MWNVERKPADLAVLDRLRFQFAIRYSTFAIRRYIHFAAADFSLGARSVFSHVNPGPLRPK